MDENTCLIYKGSAFSIKWYYDTNGKSVAYDYFEDATEDLQDKFLILVKKIGDFGEIFDVTKSAMKETAYMLLSHNLIGTYLSLPMAAKLL